MNTLSEDLNNFIYQSYAASSSLARLGDQERNQVILKIATAIEQGRHSILEANTYDLVASQEMAIPELLLEWMKLTPDRLKHTVDFLHHLATRPCPISQHLVMGNFYYQTIPIGLIAFVYEALPHLPILMAGMCLKTGNSLILRGGSEISHTQTAIANLMQTAISESELNLSPATVAIAPVGTGIKDLLNQEKYLRLILPYGRPSFVQQITKQSTLSVLPAAIGNCYLYLAPTGNWQQTLDTIKTSRFGDPDAVNAIEKIVIHQAWLSDSFAPVLAEGLHKLTNHNSIIKGCDRLLAYCRQYPQVFTTEISAETQWGQTHLEGDLSLKIVDDTEEAISWINQYSSGHGDVIMSDSVQETQKFANHVRSSNIFINCSSKFKRLEQTALGMASLKTRGAAYRGIIDLQALTTTKKVITAF